MKKIITILTLVFIVNTSYSQQKDIKDPKTVDKVLDKTSDVISKVYDDGSKVINKAYEAGSVVAPKVEQALKAIGTELKVGADNIWKILVKQQLVWSICFLVLTISALINWFLFYRRYLSKLKKDEYIIGKSKIIKTVRNPEYNSYYADRKDDLRGKLYIKAEIEDRDIQVPVNNMKNEWFIGFHLSICIILSFFSFYNFSSMMTGFINPEFGAIKTIAEIASQIK